MIPPQQTKAVFPYGFEQEDAGTFEVPHSNGWTDYCLQLDLAIFDPYHVHKVALNTLTKMKLVPLSGQEVDYIVAGFRLICDKIGRNIHDVLVGGHDNQKDRAPVQGG